MITYNSNIIQIGGSYYVRIDRKLAKRQGYQIKQLVDVKIEKVKP